MPSDPPVGGVVLTKITLEDEYSSLGIPVDFQPTQIDAHSYSVVNKLLLSSSCPRDPASPLETLCHTFQFFHPATGVHPSLYIVPPTIEHSVHSFITEDEKASDQGAEEGICDKESDGEHKTSDPE
jgi:hypothetical protein